MVGVECKATRSNPSFQKQVTTNTNGEFRVRLPFSISKHVNRIKNCSVKLIKSSEPYCSIASSATKSSIHLKSKNIKTHIFSAGYFTFKPSNQPNLCNQKPTISFNSRKFLPLVPNNPSPVQDPTVIPNLPPTDQSLLPPLPTLPRLPPLPQLPPLPALPGLPFLPPLDKTSVKQKTENALGKTELPENPQLPTASSSPPVFGFQFPPVSFRPPPLNFPPNPFLPSTPSVSVPTMNPPPLMPQPSTPVLTNPLPPFPFQPSPGLPGFTPATTSDEKPP